MSIRLRQLIPVLAMTAALAGCGGSGPQAEFVYREDTEELTPEIRNAVQEQITQSFGTPQDLVAWLKLPIDYGGFSGTTLETEEEGPLREFKFELDEESLESFRSEFGAGGEEAGEDEDVPFVLPAEGLQLTWTSGPDVGKTITVTEVKGDTVYVADPPLEQPPAEGLTFVLEAGTVMKHGRKLYMTHCVHCHGVSGDGNGPTAPYLNPLPRDYRLGVFKFKSTLAAEKVRSDDLANTIKYGIPGTYMPSFLTLSDDELHATVEYVRWLSMRGELEYKVVSQLKIDYSNEAMRDRREGGETDEDLETAIAETLETFPEDFDTTGADLAEIWANAETEEALIVPAIARVPDSFESRARGRKFFLEKCTNCHGHRGRGDGAMTEDFQKDDATGEFYDIPGLVNVWGHPVQPRNLTTGVYRGGRRPIDLYRRLYAGIAVSKMPNFATEKPETLWDTVNYVLHIPFEKDGEYAEVDAEYEASKKAVPQTAGTDEAGAERPAADGEKADDNEQKG